MAYGVGDQTGGAFSFPDVPDLGYEAWSDMSAMDPGHPLVGGQAGTAGWGTGQRQVAVAQADPTATAAAGAPARADWRELFNLSGNPIGWVLLALIAYMGLTHLSLNAGASVGYKGK